MVTNMTIKHLTPEVLARLEGVARAAVPQGAAAPMSAPVPRVQTQVPFPAAAPAPAPVAAAPVAAEVVEAVPADPVKVRMYRGRPY
jgi:hypothetical protein